MSRAWQRIGLLVLCVVGADFATPQLPGAFWIESEDLLVIAITSERGTAAGLVGCLALEPTPVAHGEGCVAEPARLPQLTTAVVSPELRREARPLRLLWRLAAPAPAAPDDH